MKRRNVTALAYGLIIMLAAATAAYAKVTPDAESEEQKTAVAVGNTEDDTNLTVTGNAGVAVYISSLGENLSTSSSRIIMKQMASRAAKSISTVSNDDIQEKVSESAKQAEKKQQEKAAEWEGRAIADSSVEDFVYIRSEADAESAAVGMLTRGAAGEVLEKGSEWTLLSSGEVTGYVSNEYLAYDEEALAVAEEVCDYVAVADADVISVREAPKSSAEILQVANEGDTFEVVEEGSEWVKVTTSECVGYMSKEVVEVKLDVAVATPIEQESTEDTEEDSGETASDASDDNTSSSEDTADSSTGSESASDSSSGSSSGSGSGSSTDSSGSGSSGSSSADSDSSSSSGSSGSAAGTSSVTTGGSAVSNSATFRVTAYCSCEACCGSHADGSTASGAAPTAGRTIAVDTSIIPLGSIVYINGVAYVAEDTGVSGYVIDIYMSSHSAALQWGSQYCTVTW